MTNNLFLPQVNLPGFYDPCLGEEKQLFIRYKLNNIIFEKFVNDDEKLEIYALNE